MEIGSHLKPGSRTLCNLASANKVLYELLLPRLLESLDSRTLLDPRFATYRTSKSDVVGKYVKELELRHHRRQRGDAVNREVKLLFGAFAANLRKLVINMKVNQRFTAAIGAWNMQMPASEAFPPYFTVEHVLVGLEHLELHGVTDRLPLGFAAIFPNVQRLLIDMDLMALNRQPIDTQMWKEVAGLKHLEEFSLRPAGEDHRSLATFPALISKIHTFNATHNASYLSLASAPQFKPTVIKFRGSLRGNDVPAELDAMWRATAKLESLQALFFQGASGDAIRSAWFPPNLVALELTGLRPMAVSCQAGDALTQEEQEQQLAQLRSKVMLPNTLKAATIEVRLSEFPDPGTATRDRLVNELTVWQSLATKSITISPDFRYWAEQKEWISVFKAEFEFKAQSVLAKMDKGGVMPRRLVFGSFEKPAPLGLPMIEPLRYDSDEE